MRWLGKKQVIIGLTALSGLVFAEPQTSHPVLLEPLKTVPGHQGSLSLQQEKQLGAQMMQSLRGEGQLSRDAIIQDYLRELGERLLSVAPDCPFEPHVFAIRSGEMNAFTFFGGHIGTYTGLITSLPSEAALMAVLSHEYAHVCQRHLARLVEQQKNRLPLQWAEWAAAVLLGALTSAETGAYAIQALLDLQFHQILSFSRQHEQEADRMALHFLNKLALPEEALLSVLTVFQKKAQFDMDFPPYLRSHPLNEARMAEVQWQGKPSPIPHVRPEEKPLFDWIYVRARREWHNEARGSQLKAQMKLLKNQDLKSSAGRRLYYSVALLAQDTGNLTVAETTLKALIEAYPNDWILDLSLAELYALKGDSRLAQAQFEALAKQYPEHYPIALSQARHWIQLKQAKQAFHRLTPFLSTAYQEDLSLHQALAQAAQQSGRPDRAHQAQANYFMLQGQWRLAKKQIELCLAVAKDPNLKAEALALQSKIQAILGKKEIK